MKIERVINKSINRQGYFWVVKCKTIEDATSVKNLLGLGKGAILHRSRSGNPFWAVATRYNDFEVKDE